MNYAELKKNDIANGYGVRVSLFVSGCTHHCPGCFNEIAWDFAYGRPFNDDAVAEVLAALAPDFVNGLSLLGGEPFEPDNQRGLLPLIRAFQQLYPHKDIWCYTGYVYDRDLVPGGRAWCEATEELLDAIHVLVDGPFIQAQADISLLFRGSANQRLLDLAATRASGRPVLWQAPEV